MKKLFPLQLRWHKALIIAGCASLSFFGNIYSNELGSNQPSDNQTSPTSLHGDDFKIAQNEALPPLATEAAALEAAQRAAEKTILINFNNVNIIEFIRFISRVSNKNFVFDENDLQFNVTIVSEEPTTVENIMSALLQELRIHGLTMFDQGNNVIVHKNPTVNAISSIVTTETEGHPETEIITQLIRLNTIDPDKVAPILKPLVSEKALIEVFKETNQIIVTDIATNVRQVVILLKNLDSPSNGLVIAQYVVRRGYIDSLVVLAEQIMRPISQDQTLIFVPHRAVNSIFIVSTPFLTERTLAILQYLDQNQGLTRIFDLNDLKFSQQAYHPAGAPGGAAGGPGGVGYPPGYVPPGGAAGGGAGVGGAGVGGVGGVGGIQGQPIPPGQGQWQLDPNGNWIFRPIQQPGVPTGGAQPPEGNWYVDENGNWHFRLGRPVPSPQGFQGVSGPQGQWRLDSQGIWVFQLAAGQSISPERVIRPEQAAAELPFGHIERTQFMIYKLRYQKGDQVTVALGKVGISLAQTGNSNADLVQTIESVQWIESSNSLIITGTAESLAKVEELISEIDKPLRQVFVELLILQTTLNDSLTYGVNFGTQTGGGNTSTAQAFLTSGSPLSLALDTANLTTNGLTTIPDASTLAVTPGFSQGIIGRKLTHGGLQFNTIGALVTAVHSLTDVNIVMNPKLVTEDNSTAEVFVGINTPFPTQAITNDRGNIITQNFDFRDVGTRFRVTPQIADNDIITLVIEEEVSSIASTATTGVVGQAPTTNRSNTRTKVHLPNGYFLVISGIMQDTDTLIKERVPCLGGLPFIGAAFSDRQHSDSKSNTMLFIRPLIVETEEEIDNVTKHQQDVFKYKNRFKKMWRYETDEAMQFFNLPGCDPCCENFTGAADDEENECDCEQYAH